MSVEGHLKTEFRLYAVWEVGLHKEKADALANFVDLLISRAYKVNQNMFTSTPKTLIKHIRLPKLIKVIDNDSPHLRFCSIKITNCLYSLSAVLLANVGYVTQFSKIMLKNN